MVTMGKTKIVCGFCKGTTELKNEDLEVMREWSCTHCNVKMSDHQFATMKATYYMGLVAKYGRAFGKPPKSFKYEIDIDMKYTPDWAVSAAMSEEVEHGTDNR